MLYKCKNCGGELKFDPAIQKLKCPFCDSVYDLEEYENTPDSAAHTHDHDHDHHDHIHTKSRTEEMPDMPGAVQNEQKQTSAKSMGFTRATDDTTDVEDDLVYYQCPHCGAEVVTDKTTAATTCVFCNTPMIVQEQVEGHFHPDAIIPFEVDKKQIGELYEQYIKNKPFYPEEYSKENVIEKIKAIYLPFWLYSMKTGGQLHARGERQTSHTTSDWIVTDHYVYDLQRGGQMDFFRVPAIASSKTPRNAMDSIEPFDYSRLAPFNQGYLPGFQAERYDRDGTQLASIARERAATSFDARLRSTMQTYMGVTILDQNTSHSNTRKEYALLPAYLLFMDYDQDEDKLIAINGQTGKIVGNIPIDNKKRMRFFISRFFMLMILFLVIAFGLWILL